MAETDRASVYCPAEVLQQEEDWGRGRQLRWKQFIWSMRNSRGGRSAPLLSKAKWDVRKGCLVPKQPVAPVSCSLPPCSLRIQPRVLARVVGQPSPVLIPSSGLPFPVGCPTRRRALSTAEHTALHSPLLPGL